MQALLPGALSTLFQCPRAHILVKSCICAQIYVLISEFSYCGGTVARNRSSFDFREDSMIKAMYTQKPSRLRSHTGPYLLEFFFGCAATICCGGTASAIQSMAVQATAGLPYSAWCSLPAQLLNIKATDQIASRT